MYPKNMSLVEARLMSEIGESFGVIGRLIGKSRNCRAVRVSAPDRGDLWSSGVVHSIE